MPTYVALLRAINVTGRFVKMQTLAEAFHRLGFEDARTYINSGNVIFSSSQRSGDRLAQALEEGLAPLLGFRAEAFVRKDDELRALAERATAMGSPLPAGAEVNVCFLPAVATPEHAAALAQLKSDIDEFEVHGREVYWRCLTRQSDSKFSNAVLERRLKLRTTLRRASMLQGLVSVL
ncbi:DUF1697 domain-containing protein [Ideonella sp. B508-1]|uniref:DUF1697 domain-containing protein n=1 Tax=Ideonella sp. B508-1 TaxID=137716 RepID=UPI00034DCF03|nr:DUF1697 domain-containing protein [Ideonella sp. B508-1]